MDEGAVQGDEAGKGTLQDLLSRAVQELGGVPRPGQQQMTDAIGQALSQGRHLLIQAGTGTGKSLGYLVPAVARSVQSGERILVSTATLALQRQVLSRDLPLVSRALTPAMPRAPKIALLKGWANYACVHKVAGGYPADDGGALFDLEPAQPADDRPGKGTGAYAGEEGAAEPASSLGEQVLRARKWAQETTTGDRDDLVPGVSERAWRQISVTSLECLGQRCPMLSECFPDRARTLTREADVVVTNHSMLGIAAAGNPNVLPEHDVLIVDEAHELTDRITAQSTAELSSASIESAARLVRRHGGVPTTRLDAAGESLGSALMELPEGRFPQGLPPEALTRLQLVRDEARDLLSALKPAGPNPAPDGGLKTTQATVNVLFEIAERMSADPSGHDVLWSSRSSDDSQWRSSGVAKLFIAPLAVSGLVRSQLLSERTGIFTSATLALGGSFDPIAQGLGLVGPQQEQSTDGAPTEPPSDPAAETRAWHGLDVGTPFNYAKQGILYVARHLPAPGREAATESQLDEIAELITAAGGRTLGLFSSKRAATIVAEAMRERLDLPILSQGEDQLPTLIEQFTADPEASLFGTLSLWQGVDVPGPTSQLVIIDRIPFPRPDDPVRSARTEAVAAAGGNGFMRVSATHAALLLAQGAGRLIRNSTDRGVVAVLDPRLATARYASFLTRSMPGLWPTQDRDTVLAALKRLSDVQEGDP